MRPRQALLWSIPLLLFGVFGMDLVKDQAYQQQWILIWGAILFCGPVIINAI